VGRYTLDVLYTPWIRAGGRFAPENCRLCRGATAPSGLKYASLPLFSLSNLLIPLSFVGVTSFFLANLFRVTDNAEMLIENRALKSENSNFFSRIKIHINVILFNKYTYFCMTTKYFKQVFVKNTIYFELINHKYLVENRKYIKLIYLNLFYLISLKNYQVFFFSNKKIIIASFSLQFNFQFVKF